jgi:nucleoside-diphosphate-sugar epimerase
MSRAVILGCGFVGARAARLFARAGWQVTGVTRSPASAALLAGEPFDVLPCDISDPAALSAATQLHDADALISAVSSGRGGEEIYRAVYLNGLRNAIACLNPKRILFVSSTSVYGRSMLLRKFLDKTAVIEGGGARHINQIHADDAAGALVHLIAGDLPAGIYNVVDDTPITQLACYEWLAAYLKEPLPPRGATDPNRKRGVTDKRVSNAKLRSLGWRLIYPSFQEAVTRDPALLAAARADGSGDAPP